MAKTEKLKLRSFGQILKDVRRRYGLNQTELGAVVDVTQVAISKWEAGTRVPSRVMQIGILAEIRKCIGVIPQGVFREKQ